MSSGDTMKAPFAGLDSLTTQRTPPIASGMRRNESAAANLQSHGAACSTGTSDPSTPGSSMRRNTSSMSLSELRMREMRARSKSDPVSRGAVIHAVAGVLLGHMLGEKASIEAIRAALPGFETAEAPAGEAGGDVAAPGALPKGIGNSMESYIETIVRQLELPNSCIIAAFTYVQRAVQGERFTLTPQNWQPCLLSAFVVAAKLSFDEPVWNEDFVKALRISNVQVSQISKWEADFLQLISYVTCVTLEQYVAACFQLQQRYQELHGTRAHFFSYMIGMAKDVPS